MTEPESVAFAAAPLTELSVLSLAENEQQGRTSRSFALPSRWLSLAKAPNALLGSFPARTGEEVPVQVRLSPLGFSCACQQRVRPCHHALALLLLYLEQPHYFTDTDAPTDEPSPRVFSVGPDAIPDRHYADAAAGLAALELWLHDVARAGLGNLASRPKDHWARMADRLLDARLSSLAEELRPWGLRVRKSTDWHAELAAYLGELKLLCEGFKRRGALPKNARADLEARLGWPPDLADDHVLDTWLVLGRRNTLSGGLRSQRVWLWGVSSARSALLSRALPQGVKRDSAFPTGSAVRAELRFYAGSVPLWAELSRWQGYTDIPVYTDISVSSPGQRVGRALSGLAQQQIKSPWRRLHPLCLRDTALEQQGETWFLRDAEGYALGLEPKSGYRWHLAALARGGGLTVFGEWAAERFRPLSVEQNGCWLDLRVMKARR